MREEKHFQDPVKKRNIKNKKNKYAINNIHKKKKKNTI